jgi:glutaredoxin-like protein
MKIIQESDKPAVEERLKEVEGPVKIINFTQELECQFCKETHWLLEDLTSLSDYLSLEVHNFQLDKEMVERYQIDKIPATVLQTEKDLGIRFYGIPSGYEFASLLDEIVALSKKDSGLSEETKEKLKELDTPIHMQVFVTPT